MINKLVVGLEDRSYPIWIGQGILSNLTQALDQQHFPNQVALITNPTVSQLYASPVIDSLSAGGRKVSVINLPDGEEYKTLETLNHIYDILIERRFDRFSGLIALGGGVIGDITGFAAATYLRGIPFIQVPTTLLSQVDSSVGGKTGVNHPQGKNLIGAFYQPVHVHIDVETLNSLPDREFAAGMAEVIKYGIIRDCHFFEWLEKNRKKLANRDGEHIAHAIMKSCQIKANVVENDEKEQGIRAILNLGHTFGHAVEALAGFGVIKHGEAVAIGMVMAARTSFQMNLCTESELDRIVSLLRYFNLPVAPPDFTAAEYSAVMQHDKKVKEGIVRLVLNHGIGNAQLYQHDKLEDLLKRLLN